MTQWFEPPGGAASKVNDGDLVLVSQGGVSRTVTLGAIRRGAVDGFVFPDAGGSGKRCLARPIWTGEVDVDGNDIWGWTLETLL